MKFRDRIEAFCEAHPFIVTLPFCVLSTYLAKAAVWIGRHV